MKSIEHYKLFFIINRLNILFNNKQWYEFKILLSEKKQLIDNAISEGMIILHIEEIDGIPYRAVFNLKGFIRSYNALIIGFKK